jgi:hypothetical protein
MVVYSENKFDMQLTSDTPDLIIIFLARRFWVRSQARVERPV